MKRRNFLKLLPVSLLSAFIPASLLKSDPYPIAGKSFYISGDLELPTEPTWTLALSNPVDDINRAVELIRNNGKIHYDRK